MGKKTTHKFKAEVSQLLDILVHSLYTNKEIFLRELVSNASDALEKVRFMTTAEGGQDDTPLEIRIEADKDARTITITDTGVGMTRDELMKNIGTIAHSGTAELTRMAQEGKAPLDALIGRFGVGFYSVYMVADEVEVTTRSIEPDAAPVAWTSDGKNDYKLQDIDDATGENGGESMARGTRIVVRLKEDLASQFTNTAHLKSVIKKHSNFINFPILVDGERVNTVTALWREPKFQITGDQYAEFYKFLTYDSEDPLDTLHTSVDAPVQFNALMFTPKTGGDPFGMNRENRGLDLYVRRVLIEKQNKDLLPEYLGFIKGVVDTEDLPLNISRETLQDNLLIRKISSTLVKQVLDNLEKIAKDDADRYAEFWHAHGTLFKAGYMDFLNKDKFGRLVRFNSSASPSASSGATGLASFADYLSRAREGQKEIYYAYGPSREALGLSPHLEVFRKKGLEVLYLFEPIDEFVMDALRDFDGHALVAAEHADMATLDGFETLEQDEQAAPLNDEQKSTLDKLLSRIKDVLGEAVTEVKVSRRLSGSPVCLANPDGNVTSSMDKIMRVISKDTSIPKKVLEVNPDHALVRNMLTIFEKDALDPFIDQAANQLFESALLLEGYLTDPHALVGRVQDLLTKSSGWYVDSKK
ncbi:MAG: molecular chaperone HtpG [Pseudodesulfovibrio sp.]|uniref:Chaperone protein HtpG n=1 Tax=Pseudodesulfovibrio aespoeensis (strain ATCC 700646 / DSM 10631 / Aspo-2) TaxID=643562 RepID=E6VVR7_PSEA9|nr:MULTISPECIES: molecular chaperone HtpG [Pseudodesulfovibrio]MBU4192184.1 molecular chaperone HtpG [Pseudomonadota bacterium]ADU61269.1 Heat shock protein Hsp90-like protein [Pseudodesulfovibrio aespoeensis Aspo-2]MBU4243949.1 molecular chaperone HtpG [Pseudomonadota bacterium]MBU4379113.1 molecular chaperone HtpG [Pseudomonadota bacterium]MBU4476780.1 molecular chaperone HtpG [Pseudomonadota bacterium]